MLPLPGFVAVCKLSSASVGFLRYAQRQPDGIRWILAAVLLSITTLVILYLLVKTIYLISSERFAQPIDIAADHPYQSS